MTTLAAKAGFMLACLCVLADGIAAQSRHSSRFGDLEGSIINVVASRTDGNTAPIRIEDLFLYENGFEQKIRNFSYDPSPSRIVILVDNSQTLPTDLDKLKAATMEFAYEIFDGDQLFVVAYDEKAEIIQEWTDDAKKMEESLSSFRKKGNPHLFDALDITLREVLIPLMPGTRKTAIVVVGDGLDRGSKTSFTRILTQLQNYDVAVYALQLPDRTGGAYRRDQPKARAVIERLTGETGGMAFPLADAQAAAQAICDELRRNRYMLSYLPINTSTYESRSVFLVANEGISLRTKKAQPPNIR
jgi:Ca-activated chloride channel homolog